MKIIDDYTAITFDNEFEMRIFSKIFFEEPEIVEKFVDEENYYNFISGRQWMNYHMNKSISYNYHAVSRTIYMARPKDRLILMRIENLIIKKYRRDKILKINEKR